MNSQLNAAGQDADSSFGYDAAGGSVQDCAAQGKRPTVVNPDKTHWVEILMQDKEGNPIAGQDYEIRLPDGRLVTGTTDQRGVARVDGIDPGNCNIRFPSLDRTVWSKK